MRKPAIILFAFLFMRLLPAHCCNLTEISLDSVVTAGPNFRIYFTVCVGAGITGAVRGADATTNTFAFSFYSTGALNVISFTPASVTGAYTGCAMPGANVGPQGPPFNSQATIAYFDPGCPNGFTCVSSTPACGNVNQECYNFMVELDAMPDSLRVFGLEGSGSPVAGCYSDPDQLIDFTAPLPVVWNHVEAAQEEGRVVKLSWSCMSQLNNDYFTIERYNPELHYWLDVGTVDGAGNSNVITNYEFYDQDPVNGLSYYRIKQTDFNGATSYSKAVAVNVETDNIVFYPMPFYDEFTLFTGLNSSVDASIQIYNASGQLIRRWDKESLYKSTKLELYSEPTGVYYLIYSTGTTSVSKKIIKY